MSILIKNVLLNNKSQDIFIKGNLIAKIANEINKKADKIIDGKDRAVLPGFINMHTHAAMVFLRGYADDMPLKEWLEKKIWPAEAKLTENDIYWGIKLACLEMIKTGTTCFNDMYWFPASSIRAVEEMGLRAFIGLTIIDFDEKGNKEAVEKQYKILKRRTGDRVVLTIAPHAIYTVKKENLIWAKKFARKNKLLLHIHVSETKKEVDDCIKQYRCRPIQYLEKIRFLGKNVILAHAVWLSDKEIKILAKRKCSIVYNPVSNMKLAVGEAFSYNKLRDAGVNVTIGTDGPSSNNNLDMIEEIKFAALLQKHESGDPTLLSAKEVLYCATQNAVRALGLKAGVIKEGYLADLILIRLNRPEMMPTYHLSSDIVYSACSCCVDSVICDGKILMQNRKLSKHINEKEILNKIKIISKKFI